MPFIMLTVLIDMAAIGLIVPVLPSIVGTFTSSQTDQAWWSAPLAPRSVSQTFLARR